MPEGPEIRKAADKVADAIVGKEVLKLEFGLDHLKQHESRFKGMMVKAVDTFGKAMVTRFEHPQSREHLNIYSHNQLYGRWVCCPANQLPESTRQLRLGIYTEDQWALLYSASDIFVLSDEELRQHPFIKKLGKDVLNPETTVADVLAQLQSDKYYNRQLGGFLTEQSFLAGLGNYLRCDILFSAGILPTRKPAELSPQTLQKLADEILRIPRQSYQTESITNDPVTVKKLLAEGSSLEHARFMVFHREGLPCYQCGTPIIKKNSGGQPCYICQGCQK